MRYWRLSLWCAKPAKALELAKQIHQSKGLKFLGLLYPAANQEKKVDSWLGKAKQLCEKAGLPPKIVSSGSLSNLIKKITNNTAVIGNNMHSFF